MLLFLTGAAMQPERIRGARPEARFVARARLQPRPLGVVAAPTGAAYETWGILLDVPDSAVEAEACQVVTDDGRELAAMVVPPDAAEPVETLAAARYWELPPAYVQHLARWAAIPVDEYAYAIEIKTEE
ncbi:MAG: hypothetical protein IT338_18150 [Thermomicrobiales bacterium]|nr:hypothetical protein [Thermomicrobiales bacterium]